MHKQLAVGQEPRGYAGALVHGDALRPMPGNSKSPPSRMQSSIDPRIMETGHALHGGVLVLQATRHGVDEEGQGDWLLTTHLL